MRALLGLVRQLVRRCSKNFRLSVWWLRGTFSGLMHRELLPAGKGLAIAICILMFASAESSSKASENIDNPLLSDWTAPFHMPPFGHIREEHFLPAARAGMDQQKAEITAIASSTAPATFQNTIEALDRTGDTLNRVQTVFEVLMGAETNDKLQALANELAPLLAAHNDWVLLNEPLFSRIKQVGDKCATLELTPEQRMLVERTYKRFVRGGALLDKDKKQQLQKINEELALLAVRFGQNVLKEVNAYRLVVENKADLAGLPEGLVAGAAEAARKGGLECKWVFTLHGPSLWPFLQYADNRELRREIFTAYITRCMHGNGTDNRAIASRMASLRAERARLLGFATWADYMLDDNMAKSPAGVYGLLNRLWGPAKEVAAREAASFQSAIKAEGKTFDLQPWDWFYYAERVRQSQYALDEEALRPYFKLDNVREGAFWVANQLYGITFTELTNLPVYSPEVKTFEVKDADGSHLAVFCVDYHPRPGKRSGAWETPARPCWVEQGKLNRPIVLNVCNFSRASGDRPALLSIDEVETLFHEFGHALHAMFSQVNYLGLGNVAIDFCELPSQIMENWAFQPEVLQHYARHWKTREVIPPALVEKMQRAKKFNQGFKTVEYLAASLLDLEWHTLPSSAEPETDVLERIAVARMGIPPQIIPRYRSTYFQHIFSEPFGYSSGYYSYIWAEVLDADAFQAFKEHGLFDRATARSFRQNILEKGYSEEPMALYKRFRGREPAVEPLLDKRGLTANP